MRIAEDGEILLRGPGVMRGYHEMPEQTAEVLESDGWLHTGDVGELDKDGYLRITDRKKDMFKTSGGKYVAPTEIENTFKALCPFVSNILVIGDHRNYCTALIGLDETVIMPWAEQQGLAAKTYAEVVAAPKPWSSSTATSGSSTPASNDGRRSRSSPCSRATSTSSTANSLPASRSSDQSSSVNSPTPSS